LPPSAMRMELTRIVSERLGLPESLAERALTQESTDTAGIGPTRRGGTERGRGATGGGAAGRNGMAGSGREAGARGREVAGRSGHGDGAQSRLALAQRGTSTERAFLALC